MGGAGGGKEFFPVDQAGISRHLPPTFSLCNLDLRNCFMQHQRFDFWLDRQGGEGEGEGGGGGRGS